MTSDNKDRPNSFRPEEMDLSQLSVEQLRELKDAIVARAHQRVGPEGFNPVMMATTKGDLFGSTEDWYEDPRDWAILVARIIYVLINVATRRVSLALAAGGAALAGSHLFAVEAGARYGGISLLVAAGFGAWLIVDLARPTPTSAVRG